MVYQTLRAAASAEVEIRKSLFIGHAAPAATEAAAWEFINDVRRQHPKATHNCFAFRSGGVDRMSDDSEPSGTAGRPIFEVLQKKGIADAVCVVTRYFGGILLGAGGLIRAYAQAAALAVEAAEVTGAVTAADIELTVGYAMADRVLHLLSRRRSLVLESSYAAAVTLTVRLPAADAESLLQELNELTAGRLQIRRLRELLAGRDLLPLHSGQ
jgi:uncharacterized YigZ family protein